MAYPVPSEYQHYNPPRTSPQKSHHEGFRSTAQDNSSQSFGGLLSISQRPSAMNNLRNPFGIYTEGYDKPFGAMNNSLSPSWMAPAGLQDIHHPNNNLSPGTLQAIQHIDCNDYALDDNYTYTPDSDFNGATFETSDSSWEDDDFRALTIASPEDGVQQRSGEAVEPYAKLIYRALMSKQDHSMVLQDIYAWFRNNTNKADSGSKGWMNSIRHNLSMNAAFKKTERKVAGNKTKKSTEWVLEPFAVEGGVQSTTRYRTKLTTKKPSKSLESPYSKQSSNRKGIFSPGKPKAHRVFKHSEPARHHDRQQQFTIPRSPMFDQISSSPPYFIHPLNTFEGKPYEGIVDLGLESVQDAQYLDGSVFHHVPEFFYDGGYSGVPNQHY